MSANHGTFDGQWADLAGIGLNPSSGGYRRFALTPEDQVLREWFTGEAAARGLDLTTDRFGNQWAWWGDPDTEPGILATAGIPAAMIFVRNPTGVSHSPAEHAERDDCLAGVDALAAVLTDLLEERT